MTELIVVITITLLAVISPGPDFAMVSRNSLLLSRRAGVLTAAGIGLGVVILRARAGAAGEPERAVALSDLAALRTGFLTNVLNPKTTVFIVSLFMQAVRPETPFSVQLAYGVYIVAAHVVWFSLVALCFSAGTVRARLLRIRHWIDRVFGALLVGLG